MPNARIRFIDIETSHLKADFGTLLCIGHKLLDEKKTHVPTIIDFPGSNPIDDENITKEAHRVLMDSDVLVSYFGKGFDIKFLQAKFLEHGLPMIPNIPHVDLFYTVKSNLALSRKSLANVAWFLNLDNEKTPVDGKIWKMAMIGDKKAIKYVQEHCKSDVLILEEAYLKLRPLVRLHPRVGGSDLGLCRSCGSTKLQSRGKHFTILANPKRRVQCTECGSWDLRAMEPAE